MNPKDQLCEKISYLFICVKIKPKDTDYKIIEKFGILEA